MTLLSRLLLAAALAAPATLLANGGHDHGEARAAPAAQALAPRFEAHSELFELVGVLENGKLVLYLDRYRDNAPVEDARLEIESGSFKGEARRAGDGTYTLAEGPLVSPGNHALTLTVTAGNDVDLLSARFEVPSASPGTARSNAAHREWPVWLVALAIGVLGALTFLAARLRRGRRSQPMMAILAPLSIAAAVVAGAPSSLQANGVHDDAKVAAPVSGGPQRLADGSVFLPKPAQRRFGIRTQVAEKRELPQSVELNGRVVMDPNAGGKVQATQSGRVEAGPRGLPTPGRAVARGEVLAYVRPIAASIERANQQALHAELRASRSVAEKKLARLLELEGTVPRKEIEQTRFELEALEERVAAVGGSLENRDALAAPVSGVIATASVVSGQVVEAREVLFEIVDPQRLMVEALAYDTALAIDISGATAQLGGDRTAGLALAGVARALRDQALPLLFRIQPPVPPLALGQAVRVVAETRRKAAGVALPVAAVVRNAANEPVVWVHESAERFAPRVVRVQSLDAARVNVVSGVAAGERVVAEGAAVLAQIR
jgi:hypothetical protein